MQKIVSKLSPLRVLDPHFQEVMAGAGLSLVLRVIGAGIALLFNLLLARTLGAQETGIYFLTLTITTIGSVVGRAGLDNSLLRFTAAHATEANWSQVDGLVRNGIGIAVKLSLLVTVIVFVGADWMARVIFTQAAMAIPLQVMSLSLVPFSLLMLYGELLRALKHVGQSAVVQAVGMPLFSLLLLIIVRDRLGVLGVCAVYAVSSAIVAVSAIILWRRAAPQVIGLRGEFSTGLLVRTSLPLFWVSLMQIVTGMAGTLILGIRASNADVAIFSIASRVATLTSFILVATNSIVAPKFAALYHQGDWQALGNLARAAARLMTILAAPFLLLFITVPGWVMGVFGNEFHSGAAALTVLGIGQFINVATGSVGYLLIMTGYEKLMRNIAFVGAILTIVMLGFLVPSYGVTGAAIATSVVLAVTNLAAAAMVYWKLHIVTLPIPLFGLLAVNTSETVRGK